MNKYFALRKANRMRTRLLTEKSQEQLKEVIRYLRRVSSVGYLMQLVVAVTAFCALFRRMMEQVGFPPRDHWLKYATWLVLYIVTLYGTGWFFTQVAGKIVLLRLPILSYSIFCLLLGAGLYAIHFWRYGKDPRLTARL